MAIFKGKAYVAALGLALVASLGLAACGATTAGGTTSGGVSTTGGAPTATTTSVNLQCAAGAVVCTKTVSVSGQAKTVLATSKGMTLYYFTPDTATTIACTGSCAQTWPPLAVTSGSVVGTGLSGALTALNGADGEQAEYNGHPLYSFSGDVSESNANGEGIGGKWFVATPALAMAASAAPANAGATNTPGGYGPGGY